MSAADNVHFIGQGQDDKTPEQPPRVAEAVDKTSRDMGKVALFVAILAVVLLVVFFFGLNQNLNGLSARVDGLVVLKNDVDALGGRMNVVEERLETLPVKAKKMVMGTMLQEMAQRAAYLSTQMDGADQNERLHRAMELLQQVQVEVAREAEMTPAPEAPAAPAMEAPAAPEAAAPEAAAPAEAPAAGAAQPE